MDLKLLMLPSSLLHCDFPTKQFCRIHSRPSQELLLSSWMVFEIRGYIIDFPSNSHPNIIMAAIIGTIFPIIKSEAEAHLFLSPTMFLELCHTNYIIQRINVSAEAIQWECFIHRRTAPRVRICCRITKPHPMHL